jgi:hypothetical protein
MKTLTLNLSIAATLVGLLSGCGDSSSKPPVPEQSSATTQSEKAPAPAPATAVAAAPEAPKQPATPTPSAAPAPLATPAAAAPASPAADLVSQVAKMAGSQSDKLLASLGGELSDKAKALYQSAGASDALKSGLTSSLESLLGGKDAAAVTGLYDQLKAANLTPEQTQLAKEVGNVASAFVVQRNFSTLDGAQGDVANIVNSLRQGELTASIPSVQKVLQNANLTAPQKDLLSTIADKYAPGLSKTAGSLQQGLQGVKSLGK